MIILHQNQSMSKNHKKSWNDLIIFCYAPTTSHFIYLAWRLVRVRKISKKGRSRMGCKSCIVFLFIFIRFQIYTLTYSARIPLRSINRFVLDLCDFTTNSFNWNIFLIFLLYFKNLNDFEHHHLLLITLSFWFDRF